MAKITFSASDLDGYLSPADKANIDSVDVTYGEAMAAFRRFAGAGGGAAASEAKDCIISVYNRIGKMMQAVNRNEAALHVYSFETPESIHAEASRLISKLRDTATQRPEYIYYVQRGYELLFNLAFVGSRRESKNYIFVKTPVDLPVQNYAVHKIPNIDDLIGNSVMCVMLRGALLPSMIMSKEIQEYSSSHYVTPFALFKISRDDTREEHTMEYTLDLDRSYFTSDSLDGKDLLFADPMNATGGSLVTVVKYLQSQGVTPRSVKLFNVIAVLKGALRIVRAIENAEIYTIWLDPTLNRKAYILPGLGDAGDRINGADDEEHPRDIIQLIADYGTDVADLYRSQVREIEKTVLGP